NIIYMGNLSLAWAYLYKQYETEDLPVFTRAAIEKVFKTSQISNSEARNKVENVLREVESILTNEQFPQKEKSKLIDSGTGFFYAYSPRKKQPVEKGSQHASDELIIPKMTATIQPLK